MIASGLLNFQRFCTLRLECKNHFGIIPICVSSDLNLDLHRGIFSQPDCLFG